MAELSTRSKRWTAWLRALVSLIPVALGLAVRAYPANEAARTRRPAAGKGTRAVLVSAITAAALALAPIAFAGAPAASASTSADALVAAPAQADPSVPVPLRDGLNTLIRVGYDPTSGFIGSSFWQAAVAVSAIAAYRQTTGDNTYDFVFSQPLDLYAPGKFENNLDDDTGWWGLAWLQAYQITHDASDLQKAEDIANYIHQDWATACGGGVWWKRSPHHDTGAIANELFLELTAWLYNTTHTPAYRQWALTEWQWFASSGMISNGTMNVKFDGTPTTIPRYLVSNSLPDISNVVPGNHQTPAQCKDTISGDLFTYNQGVILAGLAQLYLATKDDPRYRTEAGDLLTEAENIANAALSPDSRFTVKVNKVPKVTSFVVNGVLTEPTCQPAEHCGTGDEGAFKGIFVRDLKTLDVIASTTKYSKNTSKFNHFFTAQQRSIENHDTTIVQFPLVSLSFRFFGMFWAGPRNPYALVTQTSALEALVAQLNVPTQSSG